MVSSSDWLLSIDKGSHIKLLFDSFILLFFFYFFSAKKKKKLNTFTLCAIERKCERWNVSLSYFFLHDKLNKYWKKKKI